MSASGKIEIPDKEIKEEFALRIRSFFVDKLNIKFRPSANC